MMKISGYNEEVMFGEKPTVGIRKHWGDIRRKWLNSKKNRNPIAVNSADIVQWQLYDSTDDNVTGNTGANAVTAAQYTFFNVPIGQSGKTKAQTNLEQVSKLSDPQFMNVQSIGFFFYPDMVKSDIDKFLENYWFEFWVGSQKIYAEGPLQSAASGYGYTGYTTYSATGVNTLGNPNGTHLQFNLVLPAGINVGGSMTDGITGVTILQGQTFYVKVIAGATFTTAVSTAPTNGVGIKLKCFLTGILSRAVM